MIENDWFIAWEDRYLEMIEIIFKWTMLEDEAASPSPTSCWFKFFSNGQYFKSLESKWNQKELLSGGGEGEEGGEGGGAFDLYIELCIDILHIYKNTNIFYNF